MSNRDAPMRRLQPEDAPAYVALRRVALETEPLSFGASVEDDMGLLPESVRAFLVDRDLQAVFGRFYGADLVGTVGIYRASKVKQRHKATIWGMYVHPRARGMGVARALLDAAVRHAHEWGLDQVQLAVTDASPAAKRLYEGAGFRVWGHEQRALHWAGRFVDEYHLGLDLGEAEATRDRATACSRPSDV